MNFFSNQLLWKADGYEVFITGRNLISGMWRRRGRLTVACWCTVTLRWLCPVLTISSSVLPWKAIVMATRNQPPLLFHPLLFLYCSSASISPFSYSDLLRFQCSFQLPVASVSCFPYFFPRQISHDPPQRASVLLSSFACCLMLSGSIRANSDPLWTNVSRPAHSPVFPTVASCIPDGRDGYSRMFPEQLTALFIVLR